MDTPAQLRSFRGTARFELLRRLGAGGMGVVYEAFDRERNARVALKTLFHLTPESLRRFKNEFRALQDIKHPNLIALDELMEADGTWFFTMELVDGVDFLRYVRPVEQQSLDPAVLQQVAAMQSEQGEVEDTVNTEEVPRAVPGSVVEAVRRASDQPSFDEPRLRSALRQLVLGLSALHEANKVHRDIKPGNVLVTAEGRVVVLDFGLITDPGRHEARAVGTVNYMAPEQASARAVGPAADWYGVGVTLYRALTGILPFAGTAEEVLSQKVEKDPPPPAQIASGIPDDLNALCMDLLRRHPSRRPTGRTILERLGAGADAVAPVPAGTTFVGRAHELLVLDQAYAHARQGRTVSVMVHGESGVGKSALVREFLDSLDAEGSAVVLASRCYERESVPYKAVDQMMEALARHLSDLPDEAATPLLPDRMALVAEVFPTFLQVAAVTHAAAVARTRPRVTDPIQIRSYVFAALRDLIGRLGRRAPLVVSIDDLQWADADSLLLLAELLRPPAAPPLLFCATVRSPAESEATILASLEAYLGDDVRTLRIERLAHDAARELVQRLLSSVGSADDAVSADDLAEEAGGHPMFIDALVRHRLLHPNTAGPVRLDEALVARTSSLKPEAQRLLEFVCVAGGPIQQEACAHAAGIPFGSFVQLVGILRGANLVKTHGIHRGDWVEPYHDRVREAIAARMAAEPRRDAHARLARALEASGQGDPETLAVHFQESGDHKRAARFAARAAERAEAALAFDRAARLYRLALDLDPGPPAQGQRLRVRLADALSNAGRGQEAAEAYLSALDGAAPEQVFELRRKAAEQYLRSGRIGEGTQVLETVLETVGMHLPPTRGRALASFLYQRMRLRTRGLKYRRRDESQVPPELLRKIDVCGSMYPLGMMDTLRGHPFQMRNLRFSLDAGVPARIGRAMAPETIFIACGGESAMPELDRMIAMGESLMKEVNTPYLYGTLGCGIGAALWLVGRFSEALERCETAERILREECTGAFWELAAAQIYVMRSLFMLGEVAELQRRLPAAVKEATERGDLYLLTNLQLGFPIATVCLAQDDPASARRHAVEAMRRWGYDGVHLQHVYELQGETSVDLYTGDIEAAERRIAETWPKLAKAMYLRIQSTRLNCTHLRGRTALAAAVRKSGAEREQRLAAAAADAALIAKEKTVSLGGLGLLLEAGVAACRGEVADALRLLESAEALLLRSGLGMWATAAKRQRGRLLGGSEGAALIHAADTAMAAQAIVVPARFAELMVPGFG